MTYTRVVSIWTEPPPRLDRARIVETAIEVADEAGAAAVTMKAVAERLAVTPMALYRHVRNKDGLVDLMLDAATAEIPLVTASSWRATLHALALATRAMTKRHPWYAELVHTRPPAGPNQMRRVEFMLAVLTAEGATLADAMTYSAMLDRHVFGAGLQEATESRFESPDAAAAAISDMRDRAAGEYPNLATWLDAPSGPSMDEQFELVLGFLLAGIATHLPSQR